MLDFLSEAMVREAMLPFTVSKAMNDILWTLIGILPIPMYIVISTDGRVVTRQVYILSFSTIHGVWLGGLSINHSPYGLRN